MPQLISDLGRRRARALAQPRNLRAATVREDATDGDPLVVTIDLQSTTAPRRAVGWQPRGTTLPVAGDRAYVEEADNGDLVVATWQPA